MKIAPFELERWQSVHEHQVEINLSESGVDPLRVSELLGAHDVEDLLSQPLGYTQTNGTVELRSTIASLYADASSDDVLVTSGGAEANFLSCWHLVERGDDVVMMHPNFLQTQQLATAFGARVVPWRLRAQALGGAPRWAPDLDELGALVTGRTKLVIVCNPNNPTGARLTDTEMDEVCAVARRHGAWVLSDEIYRGVERDGRPTASAWGRYERVIVTSGLSKAYGLAGLRIGWVVAPATLCRTLWSYRDFTTIAPGALGDRLARVALAPDRRVRLLARARRRIADNYPIVSDWVARMKDQVTHVPPEAGAIAFVGYTRATGSMELAQRLRETHSVLVAPGAHFGLEGYLRIGFGHAPDALRAGLDRVGRLLAHSRTNASVHARD